MAGKPRRTGEFTGRHMALVLVGGFAIVAAVNFYMASLAVGGFHGVVVENSYVASQKFNTWLAEAEKARALGWEVRPGRGEDGHVIIETANVPAGARVEAELRRPLGEKQFDSLVFDPGRDGRYRSRAPLDAGRWLMRLTITAGDDVWTGESEL
ncbi:Nitrogen fixation protein FixH [Erythrobacter litoralis]|uniref:Membrane protein n=2 Tax=Erythrobacter litoralis TaxID=39960 RepID=A0A074MDH9_9SPHN|nr:FixH family protein [Erythrobacter litoralis]AOL22813.1 Nitrogen fixation protein FixH [Erythrobacter litoralis]KEO92886.1 membrane protein [Erythrobacter litoralis]MEE4338289.1 FixH family protein [Erythrobacter sp.]